MSSGQSEEANPLLQGLGLRRTPDPCVLVIFGASGDLTAKKLMPALYALAYRRLLPTSFAIVGAARSEGSDDQFREQMKQAVKAHARDPFDDEIWSELAAGIRYTTLDFADEKREDDLHDTLTRIDGERGTLGNRGDDVDDETLVGQHLREPVGRAPPFGGEQHAITL